MDELKQLLETYKAMGFDNDYIQEEMKSKQAEIKEREESLKKPIKAHYRGVDFDIKLKNKITGETKSKLRKILKHYPKELPELVKIHLVKKGDDDYDTEATIEKIAENSYYTVEELKLFNKTQIIPVNENHERAKDKFYYMYLQAAALTDGLTKEQIEVLQGDIDSNLETFWDVGIDMIELKDKIEFFRTKINI